MELKLRHVENKKTDNLEVSDAVFAVAYNEPLVHQVLTSYLSTGRAGSKSLKNRSAVKGGGKKPWRQKGLGRSRAGTIRSPIWRGGGVTFASGKRNYAKKINKKMYRGALRSILSELVRQERLVCIDELAMSEPKTKAAVAALAHLGLDETLIVADEVSENLHLATRNLPKVAVIEARDIDPCSLIGFERVLMTKPALKRVEVWLS